MTARRPWTVPLTTLLTAGFAGVVVLAAAAAGLLGWTAVRQTTTELLATKAGEVIDTLERELSVHLGASAMVVESLAGLLASGELDIADRATLERVLLAEIAAQPSLTGLIVIDAGYAEVAARRERGGPIQTLVRDQAPQPELRELADRARGRAGTLWGEVVYAGTLGDAIVNISRPVFRDGRFIGVVGAGITAGNLSTLVTRLGAAAGLTAFVLYGDDRVLAHPSLAASAGGSRDRPLPTLAELGDPVVARIWQAKPRHHLATAAGNGITVGEISGPGGPFLMVHKQLRSYGATPWVIGVAVPEGVLEPLLAPLRFTAIGAAVLPLAGFVIAIAMGRLIARPIRRATAGAEQIATLDLERVEPLPDSRIRELGAQAGAFNAMLATLRAFETYVPKSLVRRLIHAGRPDAVPSHERDMTVMFTDIAGFTTLSEALPPGDVAALLNEHFALLAGCVEAEGGTVDKYLGDGMMAFWGAPERVKDRAVRACRCALAIRAAVVADNRRRRAAGHRPVQVRVGIHRGPLLVGNIGAPGRLNYTVVGDTVNVAQRLQDLGRRVGERDCVIVVSDAVVAEAGEGFVFVEFGALPVRGRQEPVVAYELHGERQEPAP